MYKPVLESVVKNYGITINYVEYDLLSQEDKAIISSLDDKLKEFGTPYTIITKKGKIIDEIGEYVEEAELVSKLKTNKIIK